MLRKANSPTQLQERFLLALFTLHKLQEDTSYIGKGGVAYFKPSALKRVLGGEISTYRRVCLIKMENLGMVSSVVHFKPSGKYDCTCWRLTDEWFAWCYDAYVPTKNQRVIDYADVQMEIPF